MNVLTPKEILKNKLSNISKVHTRFFLNHYLLFLCKKHSTDSLQEVYIPSPQVTINFHPNTFTSLWTREQASSPHLAFQQLYAWRTFELDYTHCSTNYINVFGKLTWSRQLTHSNMTPASHQCSIQCNSISRIKHSNTWNRKSGIYNTHLWNSSNCTFRVQRHQRWKQQGSCPDSPHPAQPAKSPSWY